MEKIRIGIVGYGNLGRGVETGLRLNPDMELVGIFSRRDPASLDSTAPAYGLDNILDFKDKIDVLILCGGSKSDIPDQGPDLAQNFNTVDAYDNHKMVPEFFSRMDAAGKAQAKTSVISTGWDPGLFSLNRVYGEAVLPQGSTYTFWGRGVSQGHSDALRRVEGVKYATQYTLPKESMIEDIKAGNEVDYKGTTAHTRDCYVVLEDGADPDRVRDLIVTMPDYFADYETTVNFINEDEYKEKHTGISHGGKVIRRGKTSEDHMSVYEFSLALDSNPEFTASVNIAFARACYRLNKKGHYGAMTVLDIPPALLSPKSKEELLKGYI